MRHILPSVFLLEMVVFIFLSSCSSSTEEQKITLTPIGYFSTPYTPETGAPRQGTLISSSSGCIIIDSPYVAGLKQLKLFEYIWVLYYFNKANSWEAVIRPPESHLSLGIFATRSPRRPNPIGLSLVKIERIESNKIYIKHVDAFNGTPVLDIKPFLPSVDFVFSRKNIDAEHYLGHHHQDFINDSLVNIFVFGEKENAGNNKK